VSRPSGLQSLGSAWNSNRAGLHARSRAAVMIDPCSFSRSKYLRQSRRVAGAMVEADLHFRILSRLHQLAQSRPHEQYRALAAFTTRFVTYAASGPRNRRSSSFYGRRSVRIWDRSTRTPTTSRTLRPVSPPASFATPSTPSVFRPLRICSPPIDSQSLAGPGLHLLRQPTHRPSPAPL
jgi:hypothetical protein